MGMGYTLNKGILNESPLFILNTVFFRLFLMGQF